MPSARFHVSPEQHGLCTFGRETLGQEVDGVILPSCNTHLLNIPLAVLAGGRTLLECRTLVAAQQPVAALCRLIEPASQQPISAVRAGQGWTNASDVSLGKVPWGWVEGGRTAAWAQVAWSKPKSTNAGTELRADRIAYSPVDGSEQAKVPDTPMGIKTYPRAQVLGTKGSRTAHPAQHDSCVTSLVKVWAASFSPSTMVR